MKNINIIVSFLILFSFSCKIGDKKKTEKIQKSRNIIVNVEDKIIDIKTDVLMGSSVVLNIIEDFLIITDLTASNSSGMHFFNKHTFNYITSAGIMGKGPGEITRIGRPGIDNKNKIIWVPDYGKKKMWKFHLDSIINNKTYKPTEKLDLYDNLFLVNKFSFLNDSIALGNSLRVLSNSSFDMAMTLLNVKTNVTELFGYEHPKTIGKKSESFSKLSLEHEIYINSYTYCDLLTICDLNGNLKYNIYGSGWLKNESNKNSYFYETEVFKHNIVVAYNGEADIIYNEYMRPIGNNPSKFLVFDMDGDYKETIETNHKFTSFCVDEENKRVIIYFDERKNSLGYINLNIN
ncbi:MAG: BF3164 family lipoprotein [Bacteroidales bacterium]|jgi:hypothetical protein|nr:BF3164 family lipoprotein [Bacteroidales bacterium]